MSRLQRFPLLSKEEIADSPSVRDGVPPSMEAKRHKIAIKHTFVTAANFQMTIIACIMGIILYRRFYTRRSLKQNSSFIIACASLFLASKINDEPRSHQEIAAEMLKVWYGRPPARAKLQADPDWTTRLFATVLDGERVLLHTLGFDFDLDLPHARAVGVMKSEPHKHLYQMHSFRQYVIATCNDIIRSDPDLVLEYSATELALATIYFQVKLHCNTGVPISMFRDDQEEPEDSKWYIEYGLTEQRLQAITARFMERVYSKVGPEKTAAETSSPPNNAAGSGTTSQKRPREDDSGSPRSRPRIDEHPPSFGPREVDRHRHELPKARDNGRHHRYSGPDRPPLSHPVSKPERESSPEEGELEEGEIEM